MIHIWNMADDWLKPALGITDIMTMIRYSQTAIKINRRKTQLKDNI